MGSSDHGPRQPAPREGQPQWDSLPGLAQRPGPRLAAALGLGDRQSLDTGATSDPYRWGAPGWLSWWSVQLSILEL